jgi:hypothetical protein
MAFEFTPPADSLRDDRARFMAHVVAIGAVVTLVMALAGAIAMMSVWYWG